MGGIARLWVVWAPWRTFSISNIFIIQNARIVFSQKVINIKSKERWGTSTLVLPTPFKNRSFKKFTEGSPTPRLFISCVWNLYKHRRTSLKHFIPLSRRVSMSVPLIKGKITSIYFYSFTLGFSITWVYLSRESYGWSICKVKKRSFIFICIYI